MPSLLPLATIAAYKPSLWQRRLRKSNARVSAGTTPDQRTPLFILILRRINSIRNICCGPLLRTLGILPCPATLCPATFPPANDIGKEDLIDPPVEVSPHGTIPVPTSPGLGYHVRRDLIEHWTVEKETWRAR